jgi:soluble lytic murein transglycosylase-like protein
MQLMPATAAELGVTDSFDPAQNLDAGARHLGWLLGRYRGDLRKVLAAYNAGSGAVERFGGVPPYQETRAYVEKVLKRARTER